MFHPIEIGYYDMGLTKNEPQTHHYTFIGRKNKMKNHTNYKHNLIDEFNNNGFVILRNLVDNKK